VLRVQAHGTVQIKRRRKKPSLSSFKFFLTIGYTKENKSFFNTHLQLNLSSHETSSKKLKLIATGKSLSTHITSTKYG